MNYLLSSIDVVVAREALSLPEGEGEDMEKVIVSSLRDHAIAFEKGSISCQRMLEVSLAPFIKLARKISQEPGPEIFKSMRVVDKLYTGFSSAITGLLAVDVVQDSQGVVLPVNLLSLRKRAELVKALLKGKIAEVRSLLHSYSGFTCVPG